jgi:hypothetical protein
VTSDEYCRGLEAHLTRRNDGHLIRIVGPAFEMVRGWFERGVPFKIAAHGIDQTVERYYAKGPRRRPVRIEYCEADVLDGFDRWRRAVGLRATGEASLAAPKREGLATGIRRAIARLTAARGSQSVWADAAGGEIDRIVQALDALASKADHARGAARAGIVAELGTLDATLIAAARAALAPAVLDELEAQAEQDLAPFRDRMPRDAWRSSREAAVVQLLRVHAQLPTLSGLGAAHDAPEGDTADSAAGHE